MTNDPTPDPGGQPRCSVCRRTVAELNGLPSSLFPLLGDGDLVEQPDGRILCDQCRRPHIPSLVEHVTEILAPRFIPSQPKAVAPRAPDPAEQPCCRTCGSAITGYVQLFDKDFYEPCTDAECGREKPPIFSDVPDNVPPTPPPGSEVVWRDELSTIPEIQAQHEAWRSRALPPVSEEWRKQPLRPIPFPYGDFDDEDDPPLDYIPGTDAPRKVVGVRTCEARCTFGADLPRALHELDKRYRGMSIPMPETADQLGIGTDHLRRLRREHGLPDWRVFANQWAARQCAVLYERYSFSCPVSCPHCPDPEHGKRAP